MQEFDAAKFHALMLRISGLRQARLPEGDRPIPFLSEEEKNGVIKELMELGRMCASLDLPVSLDHVESTISILTKLSIRWDTFQWRLVEIEGRIKSELKARIFFRIESDKAKYYMSLTAFRGKFEEAFKDSLYDAVEAGKCLSLGRSTACVFHLMRTLEAGISAIELDLGITEHSPSWNSFLSKLDDRLNPKHGKREDRLQDPSTFEFYSGASAFLRRVKDGWRNPSMHDIDRKYTESEAEDIFVAVASFMRHVSTKLSERQETEAP